jgi:hypothetical protein
MTSASHSVIILKWTLMNMVRRMPYEASASAMTHPVRSGTARENNCSKKFPERELVRAIIVLLKTS